MDKIQHLLERGLDERLYSGAQLVVSDADAPILSLAVGQTRSRYGRNDVIGPANEVTKDTLFDLASLTKPLATASLMMCAVDEGLYSLDQKIVSIAGIHFPAYILPNRISDLLTHQTALPAVHDFHGKLPRREDHENARHFIEIESQRTQPRNDDNTWCYSDVGYIILGIMLEEGWHSDLDKLFSTKIAQPLRLNNSLMFRPLHYVSRSRIAATSPYMDAYIVGHPDDANARALTHLSGHAGLFGSAEAVAAFVRALLNGDFPAKRSTISHFLSYRSPNTPFCLGWDRPTSEDSLSGRSPNDNVIGHLGFTGCSVWVDLQTMRSIVLLTNRVHMNTDPHSINPLRREIHKLCWSL